MGTIVRIEGMSCAHCAARVEKALNAVPGIRAKVDLSGRTAELEVDGEIDFDAVEKAVASAGYKAVR